MCPQNDDLMWNNERTSPIKYILIKSTLPGASNTVFTSSLNAPTRTPWRKNFRECQT